MDPYNHVLLQPIYLGDFDKDGKLKDPRDPLLYWRIPIVLEHTLPETKEEYRRRGGYPHFYTDYVSKHAGCPRPALRSDR